MLYLQVISFVPLWIQSILANFSGVTLARTINYNLGKWIRQLKQATFRQILSTEN